MATDLVPVLWAVLDAYALRPEGPHGVAHWARVLENGRRLAAETGADLRVVELFAVLHDSRRLNDGGDPDHGPRASDFAATLRGRVFELPDAAFGLLQRACAGHTIERTDPDPTVQTCYDADRLDLGRVGVTPRPELLCTAAARNPETLRWADGRASMTVVPDLVASEWGLELARGRRRR